MNQEEKMNITYVGVRLADPTRNNNVRASVSITFNSSFTIHSMLLYETNKGYYLAMPSKQASDGTYYDIAHPLNNETRDAMTKAAVKAYDFIIKDNNKAVDI